MNPNLQPIIESVRQLPLTDQLELLGEISRSLMDRYGKAETQHDFWKPRTLREILENSPARSRNEIHTLKADFWPDDESADDFVDYVYKQRRDDVSRADFR